MKMKGFISRWKGCGKYPSYKMVTYRASIDIGERLILCFVLNNDSLCGNSNNDGGPKGHAMANNANNGSWSFGLPIRPLLASAA